MASRTTKLSIGLALGIALAACNPADDPMFTPNQALAPHLQPSFDLYLKETEAWLRQHRSFVSDDTQYELDSVMPFEIKPAIPNGQGVLLVHGLGDSPYSFVDIAPVLAEQGYLVRAILLPGHGSRPADLQLVELEDWQQTVAHHTKLLQQQTDGVWLGGFSTGTNLVTSYAIDSPDDIEGLLLFSTAFEPRDPNAKYTRFAKWVQAWVNQKPETNPTRYASFSMHGAATYYESAKAVQKQLERYDVTLPTFMLLAEADETVDSQFVVQKFEHQFSHPSSKLIWYGETQYADPRIIGYSMALPDQHIVSASHISPLFSPDNPNYSRDGAIRLCFDQQPADTSESCATSDKVWFAAYGLGDESTLRARTTWNPYFDESMKHMLEFMQSTQ